MKKCIFCKSEIDKDAIVCPICKKNQKNKWTPINYILVIGILVIIICIVVKIMDESNELHDSAIKSYENGSMHWDNYLNQQDQALEEEFSNTKKEENNKLSEEEKFKSKCKKIDYESLINNPEANFGKELYDRGIILYKINSDDETAYFVVNITPTMNDSNTELLVYINNYNTNKQLHENDIVDFYGYSNGNLDYNLESGENLTIPVIKIEYYDLK